MELQEIEMELQEISKKIILKTKIESNEKTGMLFFWVFSDCRSCKSALFLSHHTTKHHIEKIKLIKRWAEDSSKYKDFPHF